MIATEYTSVGVDRSAPWSARASTSILHYNTSRKRNTHASDSAILGAYRITGMSSSSVGKVFGHQWLSRWLKFRRSLARYARWGKSGKWKDSHPAVVEHDCPEINSSQRWCFCKNTPMWFGATETWAAAGLLSLARRKTTSCGNGWLETMRRHV